MHFDSNNMLLDSIQIIHDNLEQFLMCLMTRHHTATRVYYNSNIIACKSHIRWGSIFRSNHNYKKEFQKKIKSCTYPIFIYMLIDRLYII